MYLYDQNYGLITFSGASRTPYRVIRYQDHFTAGSTIQLQKQEAINTT